MCSRAGGRDGWLSPKAQSKRSTAGVAYRTCPSACLNTASWPLLPICCAGLPERLEVQLAAGGQSLVLAGFALQELELDSALALLEHLAEEEEDAAP